MSQRSDDRLGGTTTRRPLHFFWLLDVSGSMGHDGKIQALNTAIDETLPLLREDAAVNPQAQMLVRALAFATEPEWVVRDPVPVESLRWEPVAAVPGGLTELGSALLEVVPAIRALEQEGRGYAPVLVLVSDGRPTNVTGPRFEAALEELLSFGWGAASIRMAVGIGRDADLRTLTRFIGDPTIRPMRADNPQQLLAMIQWVSRYASRVSSVGADGRTIDPDPYLPPSVSPAAGEPSWDRPT